MNFDEIYKKIREIDENLVPVPNPGTPPVAPVHTDKPASEEGIEIIGPMGGMHQEQPKQQDNVTMSVSMNGSGPGGIRDLMSVLKTIEQGGLDDHEPTHHDDPVHHGGDEEPLIGDMMQAMSHHEEDEDLSPLSQAPEEEMEEGGNDETWANSAHGDVGAHHAGIGHTEPNTFSGDDMNSKAKTSPLARAPGTNSLIRHHYHVNEDLIEKLQSLYNTIKEERTEEKDEKGNVVRWKEEGEWTKAKKDSDPSKSGRGKVTNLSDKARRESEKLEKKETVKESKELNDIIALTKILKG